jgi:hypothetical protein
MPPPREHRNERPWFPVDERCTGRVKLLYVRESNPQRWRPVGYVCDGCGVVQLAPAPADEWAPFPLQRA